MLKKLAGKFSRYSLLTKEHCDGRYVRTFADMLLCRLLYGATFDDYFHFTFYDYSHCKRDTFITHRRAVSLWKEGTRESKLLMGNKVAFLERFRKFVKREWCDTTHDSLEVFRDFVRANRRVFIKPIWASEGALAQKYEYTDEKDIERKYNELKQYPDKGALVEQFIEQHPDMASLHGKSVNTIRVTTYTCKGRSHIISCALRIGAKDSCTDNYDAGGYFAAVDIATGIVTTPCFKDFKSFIYHPDSGAKIVGFQIPFWKEAVEMVNECCNEVPGARYVGWDVAILKDGPCLIEGNTGNNAYRILQSADGIGKWETIRRIRRMHD